MRIRRQILEIAAFAAALSGCSSGGSRYALPASPTTSAPTTVPEVEGKAHVVITIPASATALASVRKRDYVSPATESITVQVDVAAPVSQNVAPGSPNCTNAGANAPYNCTVTVAANPGQHELQFVTYDKPSGAGNTLSENSVRVTFVAGTNPAIPVILGGIPAALQVLEAPTSTTIFGDVTSGFEFASATPSRVIVSTTDADGNFIVGPGAPTLAVSIVGATADSGITVAPTGASNPNEYTLAGTALGNATLAITATPALTPAGTPLSASIALSDVSNTTTLGGGYSIPYGIAYDATDNDVYVVDGQANFGGGCSIHQLTLAGVDTQIAGGPNNACGFADGTGQNALLNLPSGIAYDSGNGNLYVTDTLANCAIRQITPAGVTTTIAGGAPPNPQCGYVNGVGNAAEFSAVSSGIAYDSINGDLYVADISNCAIRQLALRNNVWTTTTIAGTGPSGCGNASATGAFGVSTLKQMYGGITFDPTDGNLYVGEDDANSGDIQRVTTAGYITTIAGPQVGTGECTASVCYVNGPGSSAVFFYPLGLTYDSKLNAILVPDQYNYVLRAVSLVQGKVGDTTTIAGPPPPFEVPGDVDGLGTSARFTLTTGAVYDSVHNRAFITEQGSGEVREVSL
jgi:hypothetical protein